VPQKTIIDRSLEIAKVDFAPRHRQPSILRILLATAVSLGRITRRRRGPSRHRHGSVPLNKRLRALSVSRLRQTDRHRASRLAYRDPHLVRPKMALLPSRILVTPVLWLPDLYILVKG
jgi:hypothetical protein